MKTKRQFLNSKAVWWSDLASATIFILTCFKAWTQPFCAGDIPRGRSKSSHIPKFPWMQRKNLCKEHTASFFSNTPLSKWPAYFNWFKDLPIYPESHSTPCSPGSCQLCRAPAAHSPLDTSAVRATRSRFSTSSTISRLQCMAHYGNNDIVNFHGTKGGMKTRYVVVRHPACIPGRNWFMRGCESMCAFSNDLQYLWPRTKWGEPKV